jgi:regulation of enolase protein 1 (concanavalin A-like superfamily)
VKLVRAGNSISAYISANGGTWTPVATTTLNTGAAVFIGLAVTSHANGTLCGTSFDNVVVSGSSGNIPPTVTMTSPAEGATAVAPATIAVGATASDSDGIDHVEFYQGSTLIGTSTNGQGNGSVPYTATWSGVTAGPYTLTAKAFDTLGAISVSGPVHITVNNASNGVPAPWSTQDIGAATPIGNANGDGSSFTVQGAGDDIWNSADAFRFVYQTLTGDGQIIARVASIQNTSAWAKAGVMIREDLTVGARHASLLVSPTSGAAFEWRAQPGSTTSYIAASGSAPQWVKLVRSGVTISAYLSPDGVTWTSVGNTTLNTGLTIYVGLAVTSHQNGVLCSAAFDNVGF